MPVKVKLKIMISVNAEKAFHNIHNPFMLKTFKQDGIGNLLYIISI